MLDVFVPMERRGEGEIPFSPNVAVAVTQLSVGRGIETGGLHRSSEDEHNAESLGLGKENP